MIENNKDIKKKFISEDLGTRNYYGYRTDLVLSKIMLSLLTFLAVFIFIEDMIFSALIASEVFFIYTLINKYGVEKKNRNGKEKLLSRMKKEHFKARVDEMNTDAFEMLVGFLFEKKGCKGIVKKGRRMFLAEKDGIIECIKVYKLYDNMELEKTDIRSLVVFMRQNSIRTVHIVSTAPLSEQASEFLEKYKGKINTEIIGMDELFQMAEESGILPGNKYFYNKISEGKYIKKKKVHLRKNVFNNKKTFMYVASAIFFYVTSTLMPGNHLAKYVSFYFILLTCISCFYFLWVRYISSSLKN
ncbi:MAG TPA: hypothetical protein DEF04_06425 [Clostridiales bacterium]|nr:hypothetical protein [Clostridiales bacterium]